LSIKKNLKRGGIESDCLIGYIGPSCQACAKTKEMVYSKGEGVQCEQCLNEGSLLPISIFAIFVFLIFFFLFVRYFFFLIKKKNIKEKK